MNTTSTTNSYDRGLLRLRKSVKHSMKWSGMASTEAVCGKEMSREDIDKIDPFTYSPPFTTCGKIMVGINALWLAPIRFFLIVVPMWIVGTVMCVVALIGDRFDPDNPEPLGKWGRFVHERINPYIGRWFLFGFGFHWITVKGSPAHVSEAPIMVVAPHSSMLDIFIMVMFGTPTFVARVETRETPVFGPIITRTVRAIYVSREDPNSRAKSAEEIRRRTSAKGMWPKILIYPEGTTTNRACLLKFKPGAFNPKLPVQPVLIKYNNRVDTTSWGGDGVGLIGTLFYTICQFHNSLEVEFLPVYTPSQAEMDDTKLFANNVQKLMAKRVGIPAGDQSIEDLILMRHARSLGLPFSKGMVVYYKTYRETGIRVGEMKKWLTRFAAIDRDGDGLIEMNDLENFLQVPSVQTVFDSCRKDEDGKVSFPNYLRGIVSPAISLLNDETFLQEMFIVFDRDSNNFVQLEDFREILQMKEFPSLPKSKKRSDIVEDSIPPELDLDLFKTVLLSHPEYVLLFQERQSVRCTPPSTTEPKANGPKHRSIENGRSSLTFDRTSTNDIHSLPPRSDVANGSWSSSCRSDVELAPTVPKHTMLVQVDVEA